jgi:hypothetical protein
VSAGTFKVYITVANGTNADVTFVESGKECISSFPPSFIVPAGASTQIEVDFKTSDADGDFCWSDDKKIAYAQSDNTGNHFSLESKDAFSSAVGNQCLVFVELNFFQAMCPQGVGSMLTAYSVSSGDTVICPPGVPSCPPYNGAGDAGYFGFLLSNDSVGVAPPDLPSRPIPATTPLGSLFLILALAALSASRLRRR